MNVDLLFPSEFVKEADLGGRPLKLMVLNVRKEKLFTSDGTKAKPVMLFDDGDGKPREKRLILNKTNVASIASVLGKETDDWRGKWVVLIPSRAQFQGRTVPAIRVDEAATRRANRPTREPGED